MIPLSINVSHTLAYVSIDLDSIERFDDDDEMNEWGRESIYFMATNDIIRGIGENTFGTQNNATIEQALAIALRSCEVFGK